MNYGALVYRMKECGFTQKDVAEKIGISQTSLSLKLNNRVQFQQDEIAKLAELLQLDYSEIGFFFFTKKIAVTQT